MTRSTNLILTSHEAHQSLIFFLQPTLISAVSTIATLDCLIPSSLLSEDLRSLMEFGAEVMEEALSELPSTSGLFVDDTLGGMLFGLVFLNMCEICMKDKELEREDEVQ